MNQLDMRPLPRKNGIRLACILFLLVSFVLLAAAWLHERNLRQARADEWIAMTSRLLEIRINGVLRETDLALNDLAVNPLVQTALQGRVVGSAALETLQTALDAPGRHVAPLSRIRLVSPDCRIVAASQGAPITQPLDKGLCAWLHGRGRRQEPYFTGTDLGRGGLIHAYRLYGAEHTLSGMLVAQISGNGLAALAADVASEPGTEFFISDQHRQLAAAWPVHPASSPLPGDDGSQIRVRQLEDKHLIFDARSPWNRGEYRYSLRQLDNYPLSVAVGFASDRIRGDMAWQAVLYLGIWLVLAGLALGVCRRLLRQRMQNARLRFRAVRLLEDRTCQRALLEALPIALLLVDPASIRIHLANRQARELLHLGNDDDFNGAAGGALPRLELSPLDQWLTQGHWTDAREIDIEQPGQESLHVLATLAPFTTDGQTLCMVALQDRSDRRQLEAGLADARAAVERLESTDVLTRLANRKTALQALAREAGRCQRYGLPMCAATLDIDHFSAFNERYGHEAGDNVLIALANALRDSARNTDLCARIDGEEFLLIFTNTPLKYAQRVMERIRDRIGSTIFPFSEQRVTFSGGLTCWQPDDSVEALLQRMSEQVARAREAGRNQVCCDEDSPL